MFPRCINTSICFFSGLCSNSNGANVEAQSAPDDVIAAELQRMESDKNMRAMQKHPPILDSVCKCSFQCGQLSADQRRLIWHGYWALGSRAAQMRWIWSHIRIVPIKQHRLSNPEGTTVPSDFRRTHSREYYLPDPTSADGAGGGAAAELRVCKLVFRHTLGFKFDKFITHALQQRYNRSLQNAAADGKNDDAGQSGLETSATRPSPASSSRRRKSFGPCPVCNRDLKCVREQQRHAKMHSVTDTRERPFVCGLCGKGFMTNHHLTQHAISHTDIRNYACEECGKRYRKKRGLEGHMKLHRVPPPEADGGSAVLLGSGPPPLLSLAPHDQKMWIPTSNFCP